MWFPLFVWPRTVSKLSLATITKTAVMINHFWPLFKFRAVKTLVTVTINEKLSLTLIENESCHPQSKF